MTKFTNIFGRFLAVISISFLFIKLVHHFNEIPEFTLSPGAVFTFISAVMFSASITLIGAYIWRILLRGGEIFLSLKRAYIIMGQIQVGKYLPGNVFHYIGRVAVSRRYGISPETVMLSMGVETFIAIATAATIAICGLLLDNRSAAWIMKGFGIKLHLMHIMGAVLLIAVLSISLISVPRTRKWIRPRLAYLHIGRMGISAFLYISIFFWFGLFISLLLKNLWGASPALHWYQFAWGFTLAWVLGFVTPGAPGGIGIRELVFVGLYGKELGEGLAVGLAVVLRVITSLGDLLTFVLAYWLGRQENGDRSK